MLLLFEGACHTRQNKSLFCPQVINFLDLNNFVNSMSEFTGFTESDIKNIHNTPLAVEKHTYDKTNKNVKLKSVKRKERILKYSSLQNVDTSDLPEEAKLHVIKNEIAKPVPDLVAINESQSGQNILKENDDSRNEENASKAEERIINIADFESRQKVFEEQNKRRKELLVKALEDRARKTREEQLKLNQIEAEFKKIDADLSNDVKILRRQIEAASLDYMEAERHFLKKEREYLDTKIALHDRKERKEMLTEHLCAIIQQNEQRKATKLDALLGQLHLKADLDNQC